MPKPSSGSLRQVRNIERPKRSIIAHAHGLPEVQGRPPRFKPITHEPCRASQLEAKVGARVAAWRTRAPWANVSSAGGTRSAIGCSARIIWLPRPPAPSMTAPAELYLSKVCSPRTSGQGRDEIGRVTSCAVCHKPPRISRYRRGDRPDKIPPSSSGPGQQSGCSRTLYTTW
jgi:hypothetical protein